jgi:hypothetical protein
MSNGNTQILDRGGGDVGDVGGFISLFATPVPNLRLINKNRSLNALVSIENHRHHRHLRRHCQKLRNRNLRERIRHSSCELSQQEVCGPRSERSRTYVKRRKTPDKEVYLAQSARILSRGVSPLFHGTRYLSQILQSGALEPQEPGDCAVCFTRSPEEAAYWATIERDDPDEYGAILVFDRDRLKRNFRLEPISTITWRDEHEERVWYRDIPLGCGLIGIVQERPASVHLRRSPLRFLKEGRPLKRRRSR